MGKTEGRRNGHIEGIRRIDRRLKSNKVKGNLIRQKKTWVLERSEGQEKKRSQILNGGGVSPKVQKLRRR